MVYTGTRGASQGTRSRDAGHCFARGAAVGQDSPGQRGRPAWVRLLHELSKPEGARAGGESPRCAGLLLARTESPGAGDGPCGEDLIPPDRRIFSRSPARRAVERLGIVAKFGDPRPRRPGTKSPKDGVPFFGPGDSAATGVGRVPAAPGYD